MIQYPIYATIDFTRPCASALFTCNDCGTTKVQSSPEVRPVGWVRPEKYIDYCPACAAKRAALTPKEHE